MSDKLYRVKIDTIAEHSSTKRLEKEWISQVFTKIGVIPDHAIPGLLS
jgi:hypothetical protein